MTDAVSAVILGIVEGLTEFLPVSSTGHLIIVNKYIYFGEQFTKMFDIVIQLGAILSVVIYFRKKLIPFGKEVSESDRKDIFDTWKKAIVGVIPALVIGAAVHDYIEQYLFTPVVVSITLIIWGIFLIIIDRGDRTGRFNSIKEITYTTAILIGFIQCLSMVPGTSRSAATIIGAMLLGVSRIAAVEYSFFLSIPTMVAASGYSLLKSGLSMNAHEAVTLSIGFIVSFFVAWMVIAFFMKYITSHDFRPFGYYRIILGIIVLIWLVI
ncbi:MAG: undecaprenyl-diphosphatase [Spirochaetae bacterium HGW-Spirochaetae-1]|jgi:undecaprenyl-diphosphatase|nr:MAG: undecaprenyl-diphosphatase [Spirochaetae bacterium HGW-Spirochaetae-1]